MGLSFGFMVKQDTYTHEVVQYNNIEAGAIISIAYGSSSMSMPNPIGVKPNSKVWIALKSSQNRLIEPSIFKVFETECRRGLKLDMLKGKSSNFGSIVVSLTPDPLVSCLIPALRSVL